MFIAGMIIYKRKKKRGTKIRTPRRKLEKVQRMMEVSTRIELEMMRKALKMDEDRFSAKIFEWAHEFGFVIDGKFLIVKQETISDFMDELDKQFDTWHKEEEERSKKN